MNLKVEDQYSYFIYPFYIKQGNYADFISSIVENSKWEFQILNDINAQKTASFFLPDVRKFLFPTLEWSKKDKEAFKKYTNKKKILEIAKLQKATFEYKIKEPFKAELNIKNNKQLKFDISKIMLITFERGVGLLILKTQLEDDYKESFNNILDFNYYFREINLFHEETIEDEVVISCSEFKRQNTVSKLVKHLLNDFTHTEKDSIYYDRLFTYAYTCLDENEWNEEKKLKDIIYSYFKFKHVLPGEFESMYYDNFMRRDDTSYSRWTYSMYGFLKESGVVLGSAREPFNIAHLPSYFESTYFYIFVMAMYQRMVLILLSRELVLGGTKKIDMLKEHLMKFTNMSWFNQITNSEQGMDIWKKWQKVFELNTLFEEVQREFTEYYEYTFAKGQDRINRFLVYVFIVSVAFPGITLLIQFGMLDKENELLKTFVIIALAISLLYYPAVLMYKKFFKR